MPQVLKAQVKRMSQALYLKASSSEKDVSSIDNPSSSEKDFSSAQSSEEKDILNVDNPSSSMRGRRVKKGDFCNIVEGRFLNAFIELLDEQTMPKMNFKNWGVNYPEYELFYFNHCIMGQQHCENLRSMDSYVKCPLSKECDHVFVNPLERVRTDRHPILSSEDDVLRDIPCQHLSFSLWAFIIQKVSGEEMEYSVRCGEKFIKLMMPGNDRCIELRSGRREFRWSTNISMCMNTRHIIVVSYEEDKVSSLQVFDHEGQLIQSCEIPLEVPESNAVCLVDSSERFIVVGVIPLCLSLYRFDEELGEYKIEYIIDRQELGLGLDFIADLLVISSSISTLRDGTTATLICVAVGISNVHSIRMYKIDHRLFPCYRSEKQRRGAILSFNIKSSREEQHCKRMLDEDFLRLELSKGGEKLKVVDMITDCMPDLWWM